MLYRVKIDLSFQDWDAVNDIVDKATDHLGEAVTINPGQPNEERGFIRTEECHHDESPSIPCTALQELLSP
ncbi:hypothetical protein ES703_76900 [subsurface metagenome]